VAFFTNQDLTTGCSISAGGAGWDCTSDRNAKKSIAAVDGNALLASLMNVPVFSWNYKTQDNSIRHMGPLAQDFKAAFGLGEDDKHISTVDADGVSLAAIQALYRLTLEKDKKIDQLSRDLEALQAEVAELQKALK
jgi:hypothetical protein